MFSPRETGSDLVIWRSVGRSGARLFPVAADDERDEYILALFPALRAITVNE